MNGQHLKALPAEELIKTVGEQWKSANILNQSEGLFIEVRVLFPNTLYAVMQ